MEFYQANQSNQYPTASNNKLVVISPRASSSSLSSSTDMNQRKRNYIKAVGGGAGPKSIVVEKRRKDILTSIAPSYSNSQNHGGEQEEIKNLLNLFQQQSSSNHGTTRVTVSPNTGRGRPTNNSKTVSPSDNMNILPADRCAYSKHKSEDRIQRLFVFTDYPRRGCEFGFYTRSKDQNGTILHGFYCMECSNIRKKREFDALIKVDKNGHETFYSKEHVEGCQPRDNNNRYVVKPPRPVGSTSVFQNGASSSTTHLNERTIQNMIRTAIEESSQQLIASMIEQIRDVVREEIATQLHAVNNNFDSNY